MLENELENLRLALTWSLEQKEVTIAVSIYVSMRDFWFYQGYHVEALNWINKILPFAEDLDISLRGRF